MGLCRVDCTNVVILDETENFFFRLRFNFTVFRVSFGEKNKSASMWKEGKDS